jgi:hypothetical protein
MDRDAFDGLTKALAVSPNRRRALSAGLGLLLASGGAPDGATAPRRRAQRRRARRRRRGSGRCDSVQPGGCETLWASCRAVLDAVIGSKDNGFQFNGCCQQLGDATENELSPIVLNEVCLNDYFCPPPHAAAASPAPSPGQQYVGPCANLGLKCEQSLKRRGHDAAVSCCAQLATCEVGRYIRCLIDRHALCPPSPG